MTTRQTFKKLSGAVAELLSLPSATPAEERQYYVKLHKLKESMAVFILQTDFVEDLSHGEFLTLCGWVSKYRPLEPFRFLLLVDQHHQAMAA
jgi:hypothetical protein